MFQKYLSLIIACCNKFRIKRLNLRINRLINLKKWHLKRSDHCQQKIDSLRNCLDGIPYKPSSKKYEQWLQEVSQIAENDHGIKGDNWKSLDDGTYLIFFNRGYSPQLAMQEIWNCS